MAKVSIQHLSNPSAAAPGPGAVRDFSLEVSDRELVVLAGRAGSGAATVLRLIAGLNPAAAGEIALADKPVGARPARERDIAMVFRGQTLYPRMTVGETIAYGLKLRKQSKAEIQRRVTEAAESAGVAALLEKRPASLSPEQIFRAALARAIARQPKLFLLDDPLADFDAETRARLRVDIRRLHSQLQATILHSTENAEEAMTLGDRVAVMHEGTIRQAGPPLTLYREPDDLFVAGYLGHPPMNFVRGKLREAGETVLFKESGEGVLEIKFTDRPWLKTLAGREVTAGIRPEDLAIITSPARPGTPAYRSLLDVVEPSGAGSYFHLETGAHRLTGWTREALGSEEAGHRVQFEIDPAKVQLFDPESTRRITA